MGPIAAGSLFSGAQAVAAGAALPAMGYAVSGAVTGGAAAAAAYMWPAGGS